MDEPDPPDGPEEQVVSVTESGQVTIPEWFLGRLGIDTPGKVCFRETADDQVIVERVPSANEMRGFAAEEEEVSTEGQATDTLREKRGDGLSSEPGDRTTSGWKLSEWNTGRSQEAIGLHRELLERAEEVERGPRTVERDE
ncbi:hypothetical protein GCM10028857_27820 [Salinarchaeum chitinilyticum]